MTKKLLPNGLEVVYSYNDANWVTAIILRQTSNPSNVIQSFEYGYDKVGNRLWVRNADGRGDVYKYDPTYQLVGVKYNVLDPAAGYDMAQGHSRSVTYHYDALGNRTQVVDGSTLTEYSANNLNQITQVGTNEDFAYDADGNLTGDGTWTYGYDREGRLISATDGTTSVTYSYDAVGRRMSKTVGSTTTQYVYSGQDLIEERDGSGAVLARYIYAGGIDNPVAVVQGTNTFFYQQDALGNVTAITDSTGAIVESYTYDAFGQPTIKDGDGDPVSEPMQPFLFTGREWDAETGLYHYRTRAYSPELGRFLQADSIGFGGGDMNLYRYVANNPINWIDPMGTMTLLPGALRGQARGRQGMNPLNPDSFGHDYSGTQMHLENEEEIKDQNGCCSYKRCIYGGIRSGNSMAHGGKGASATMIVSCDATCPSNYGWAPHEGHSFKPPQLNINTPGPQGLDPRSGW